MARLYLWGHFFLNSKLFCAALCCVLYFYAVNDEQYLCLCVSMSIMICDACEEIWTLPVVLVPSVWQWGAWRHTHRHTLPMASYSPGLFPHAWCSNTGNNSLNHAHNRQTHKLYIHTHIYYCLQLPSSVNRSWQLSKQAKFTQSCDETFANNGQHPLHGSTTHLNVCVCAHIYLKLSLVFFYLRPL